MDSIVAFQALNDPRYTVFSHGSDQTASLTVSGGVPTLTYSLSGSVAGDVGNLKLPASEIQRYDSAYGTIPGYLVRPDLYTTWGVSGQLTAQPNATLHVTLQSSLFNSNQQQGSLQTAIYQLEGEYIAPDYTGVLIQNDVEKATDHQLTSTNAVTLNWQPVRWLPLSATGGINTIQRTDQSLIPYGVNSSGPGTAYADTTGSYGLGRGTSQVNTLTLGTTIPSRFVNTAFGFNLTDQSTADFQASTDQLAPGVTEPTTFMYTTGSGPTQYTTASATYGYYVEPRLNVSSRFFVAPGFRLDGGSGGSSIGSSGLSGLSAFPKIDLSYVAVDQQHPRGMLTLFRPRLAFGYAGIQPPPAEKLRLINANDSSGSFSSVQLNDSTTLPYAAVNGLGNTQLRPETSAELEGGFDAELWHGRVAMTYTQYNKTRHNAIIPIPVAPSVYGTQTIDFNIGEVRNTGHEITMNVQVLTSRMVSWTVGGNFSNDNNLIVKLAPGFLPNKSIGIVAGYPLFGDWARPIVSFSDQNHNGIIDANEVILGDSLSYVGQAEPKYQANFNTALTLLNGRLSINATFTYQNGLTQNNVAALTSGTFATLPNGPGNHSALEAAYDAAKYHQDDIGFYQTVNTLRFNDLSINYTLPKTISSWFRVPFASIALQGQNLGLRTNYRGIDPGVNAFSTVSTGDETADLGQLPSPRTWWLKLHLGS